MCEKSGKKLILNRQIETQNMLKGGDIIDIGQMSSAWSVTD